MVVSKVAAVYAEAGHQLLPGRPSGAEEDRGGGRQTRAPFCRITYWYGFDARGLGERELAAYLANLDRLQAERKLMGDCSKLELTAIRDLVAKASGSEEVGERVMADVYAKRMMAQVEADARMR